MCYYASLNQPAQGWLNYGIMGAETAPKTFHLNLTNVEILGLKLRDHEWRKRLYKAFVFPLFFSLSRRIAL